MEYTWLASEDVKELIARVNEYMAKGWRPQGGPFIFEGVEDHPWRTTRHSVQAMVFSPPAGDAQL